MNILHVVHGYPPSSGGSQWMMSHLSERLVADFNDEVTVFTSNALHMAHFWGNSSDTSPVGVTTENGVSVRRFAVNNRFSWVRMMAASAATRLNLPGNDWLRTWYNGPLIPGLLQAIAAHPAQVVTAMAFPLHHMYDALHAAKTSGKAIIFIGGLHPADRWGFDRPMIYRAIQQADAYIALTHFERDFLLEKGIKANKITVAGGGVDEMLLQRQDPTAARRQVGWGSKPVVLMLAKHTPRKRFDLLFDALPDIWRKHPKTRIVLAGAQTSYTPALQARINTLSTTHRSQIHLLTDITETTKRNLLAACNLLVLPSTEESFGIVFTEAWAQEKPVVGARQGAVGALINDEEDGLLFTPDKAPSLAKAVNRLLSNPVLQQAYGQAGRQKVLTHYTWPIITAKIRNVYTTLTVP